MQPRPTEQPGSLQTEAERQVPQRIADVFATSPDDLPTRLATMARYARRSQVTRFAALYELFKLTLPVKGSIVECGVFRGASFMTFAQLSAALEPTNLTRRLYGFDSFGGFPSVSAGDRPDRTGARTGDLAADSYEELSKLLEIYDTDRFLGHLPKARLIRGDVTETIPAFVADNQHLVVSLLFLDLDLYEPTRVALQHFLPRMPKGAVLAFDELDNPIWPGETKAALDEVGLNRLELRRFDFDPYIGYAVL
ncbi:TylF/MycF/NovP-related O-methyltransferase [Paractinoplanes atraurantiacus]|uniref:Macrocin-O-methyltransferase (TylF) n=1 Tax=Paractinoplanes atraurantiacus TaxID=1036182 RepID=A0A285I7Q3_9ACTN|nr:TylF/MycF/NovP-related O-methyltransferase [Actinoplanes atraurantiacus]SNY44035.1 Macrocin-O-methyltransferase (TylF) [Actinoplanes atraurantiacus]